MRVDIGRARDREAERHHELGFGEVLCRGLVHDLRHRLGALEQAVAHDGIAMDEDALPRHQHIVEYRQPVALIEPRRQREIHRRGGVLVYDRWAADKAQPLCRYGNCEAERIRRGFVVGRQKRRGHDQDFVGIGAQGRDHARAVHDDAGIGFLDDLGGEVLLLALDRARAIDLRIEERVRHAQIALAGEDVIGADIVGEALVGAGRIPAPRRPARSPSH